ncbi:MAG TPA: hypothetical protein VNO32_08190 [Candidatus Acidoferrum sp.]|nr:hypothetical protein [Candidatus Acidoferrum sp.]
MSEVTWISITDAAPQFGMTPGAIMNLISRNKFPVPTYKLGKKRVIDLVVLTCWSIFGPVETLGQWTN